MLWINCAYWHSSRNYLCFFFRALFFAIIISFLCFQPTVPITIICIKVQYKSYIVQVLSCDMIISSKWDKSWTNAFAENVHRKCIQYVLHQQTCNLTTNKQGAMISEFVLNFVWVLLVIKLDDPHFERTRKITHAFWYL